MNCQPAVNFEHLEYVCVEKRNPHMSPRELSWVCLPSPW